jgi:ABC-2 type transport system permease protein
MNKILTVARTELTMIVRSRAFMITLLFVPVMVTASIVIPRFLAKQGDVDPRRFAVIDRAGTLYDELAAQAEQRNARIRAGLRDAPFHPEKVEPAADAGEQRLALSERVRAGEIWAFVEIPERILDGEAKQSLRYYSNHPTYDDLPRWIRDSVDDAVRGARLRKLGIDDNAQMARLFARVEQDDLGLFERGPRGEIVPAAAVNPMRAYGVPFGLMYILFLTIFISAPQLMNAVITEKMTKISEVLLGSVTPFELMLGKLLGGAGASAVMATVYVGGAAAAASQLGIGDALSPQLVGYFLLFMALAILLYGSIFVAVGAAVSDLKDAQSLITPVMLIAALPMFTVMTVMKSPASPVSVGLSLIPPMTPFVMLLRLALQPPPPLWQVLAGITLTGLFAFGCVAAAGKIFRVGILASGKSASLGDMIRWLRAK